MKKLLISIFQHKSGGTISSKRVCGVLGWIVILVCYAYSIFKGQEPPSMGELIAAVVALLGVDSVTDAYISTKNQGE